MYSKHEEGAKPAPTGGDTRLTEARNPRTADIDRADTTTLVRRIQAEDRAVPTAVESQAPAIARLIDEVVGRFRRGGRLIYVGAGTSGRLGMLDAAECPPTFGTDPELVRGVIAGGEAALARSSEGSEDDASAGARALSELGVGAADFVLGIATSGTTPYVHGALEEARRREAGIGFLSCTAPPEAIRALEPFLVTPLVGPEVIAGSTRLKAGTATKLVLNTVTTGAMIRTGRVYGNLMVDLRARSAKLVDRGIRIVSTVCEVDRETARGLLVRAGGSVKTALAMRLIGTDRGMAERCLDAVDGFLAIAVERRAGTGCPHYAGYPEEPGWPDTGELARRLARASTDLTEARAGAVASDRVGRLARARADGWTPSQHVAHLLQFEREAIGERVRRYVEEDEPEFVSWEPDPDPPGGGDPFPALIEALAAARRATLAPLDGRGSGIWRRRAILGEERPTLYQFLRGIHQHDGAHALRIGERVHPALLEPGAGLPGADA